MVGCAGVVGGPPPRDRGDEQAGKTRRATAAMTDENVVATTPRHGRPTREMVRRKCSESLRFAG